MSHRPTRITLNRTVITPVATKIIPFCPDMLISGGQSGVDFGALLGANACGILTGGVAPKGWRTESGPKPDLGSVFGLIESHSDNYNARTLENIQIADAIVIIALKFDSPGTALTRK